MENMTSRIPEGIAYEVHDAGNSQSVQNQQITEAISRGVDLLVVNAVDRLASSAIVSKAAANDIPIMFFNREPLEDVLINHNIFYIGIDSAEQGRMQAEMVAELFTDDFRGSGFDKNDDGIVQLVIIKGEQGHQDAERRTDNCVARFVELGFDVDVLAIEVADWDRLKGYGAMRRLYAQFGDSIELVFSNNDDMALGAIDYLLDIEEFSDELTVLEQPIIIVGVDGTAVGLEAIERGLLYGTINNDSVKQADAVLTLADYILYERNMDDFPYTIINGRYIYIDGDIITQANIAEFR
jgi:methyl-galactoside transport system substrate-binding protein